MTDDYTEPDETFKEEAKLREDDVNLIFHDFINFVI